MSKNKTTQPQQPAPAEKPEEVVLEQQTQTDLVKEEQAPVVETAPVEPVKEEPAPLEVVQAVQTSPFEEGALVGTPKKSLLFEMVISGVEKYAKEMGARIPQTPATGAIHQKNLYGTYEVLFKLNPPEMREALDRIIAMFKANETGCFTEAYLFRFSEHIAVSKVAAKGFYNFSHLLLTAAQLGRREAGRLNDMGSLVGWLPSEDVHQLLVNYFR